MVYGDINILRAAYAARTAVTVDFGEQLSGALDATKIYATGSFLLTALEESAPDAGNATYKASFEHASGFTYVDSGALTVRIAHTNALTHGGSTGMAMAMPRGGTVPYTYVWTGGATTQYITGKVAGTYVVTVTDNVAATATATVIITEP
jgi:hypothetical protein